MRREQRLLLPELCPREFDPWRPEPNTEPNSRRKSDAQSNKRRANPATDPAADFVPNADANERCANPATNTPADFVPDADTYQTPHDSGVHVPPLDGPY